MVLILKMVKIFPLRPRRFWQKNTGSFVVSLTTIIENRMNGKAKISKIKANKRLKIQVNIFPP
jgi:hypothetical protein